MAFGQASGLPATARQLEELRSLLLEAGHTDFRDARGPMGFTQRQAGGRFTRDEADGFITRLQAEDKTVATQAPARRTAPSRSTPPRRSTPVAAVKAAGPPLTRVPAADLAAELQRRGWMVIEPLEGP